MVAVKGGLGGKDSCVMRCNTMLVGEQMRWGIMSEGCGCGVDEGMV